MPRVVTLTLLLWCGFMFPARADEESASSPAQGSGSSDPASPPAEAKQGPWRLREAIGLPEWLHVEGTHQARYEYVWNQFRAGVRGDNRGASLRTTVLLELRLDPVVVGAELEDARIYGEDDDAPLNTGIVNAMELLQAYGTLKFHALAPDLFGDSKATLRAGRITLNLGSRRLVARNVFRNTINAFTGVEGRWKQDGGWDVRGLLALPIQRRPSDRDSLKDNDIQFDRERKEVHFWGLFVATPPLTDLELTGEVYLYGLNESDTPSNPTRNRELYTPGVRLFRSPAAGTWDFEVEAAMQFGNQRASSASTDVANLSHLAYFAHLSAGFTFDTWATPRLSLVYDYASGDRNPSDGDSERFDTLFGVPREFNPTGLFTAINRGNLNSPGVRLELKPHPRVSTFVAYRGFWLATRKDAWVVAGVQDPGGDSGYFVGHLLEARARWEVLPGNVRLELGVAGLIRGRFAKDAPNSSRNGEPLVVYAQVDFTF
jgi:Alginate export